MNKIKAIFGLFKRRQSLCIDGETLIWPLKYKRVAIKTDRCLKTENLIDFCLRTRSAAEWHGVTFMPDACREMYDGSNILSVVQKSILYYKKKYPKQRRAICRVILSPEDKFVGVLVF